ncbi:MAG: FHIPEP family type III secretion protein, partial [Candidatus Eremiobacteraeota bacterium]|nr:FHIPEP family type III secretion protein [Candidatus Eremiobacteraeota bacterium]
RERIWPRDPVTTLEALVDAAVHLRDPRDIAERVRMAIVPALLRRTETLSLEALILAPSMERELCDAWVPSADGAATAAPDPALALRLQEFALTYAASAPRERGAAICAAKLRPLLADFFLRAGIAVPVFSYGELPPEVEIQPRALFGSESALAAS